MIKSLVLVDYRLKDLSGVEDLLNLLVVGKKEGPGQENLSWKQIKQSKIMDRTTI